MKEAKTHQFKGILEEMPNSKVYNRHFKIPGNIKEEIIKTNPSKRVMCSVNGSSPYPTGLMPYGNGIYYVMINKQMCKKLRIDIGQEVTIGLANDESKYGMPIPEEFEVLLEQDIEGCSYFEALSPGKKRTLLHLLGKPKSSDIRLTKSIVLLNYLKQVHGKLEFKELNEAFKAAKQ